MWNDMLTLFREYVGTGFGVLVFALSLIYLWRQEGRREYRILFIYLPIVLLLLYFNPWFARKMYEPAGAEGYYRILWLMPFTLVVAYTIVHIY